VTDDRRRRFEQAYAIHRAAILGSRQGELMNDETLLSRLAPVTDEQAAAMVSREALSELAEEIIRTAPHRPPAAQERRHARHGSRIRRSRRLPLALGAASVAGAVAVVLIVPAGHPAPGGRIAQNETSGLRPRSARAVPSGSTTLDAWTVTENGDGTVLQNLNRAGLPTADGAEFIIRPSLIPAAALLWLGINQTGKPNGVVGPPGPSGAAYLTATQACAAS
jgi:hypothetical protein